MEVVVGEAEEVAVPGGANRGGARITRYQGQLADGRSAAEHAEHANVLIVLEVDAVVLPEHDLETPGVDYVKGIAGIALSHQPVARLDGEGLKLPLHEGQDVLGQQGKKRAGGEKLPGVGLGCHWGRSSLRASSDR